MKFFSSRALVVLCTVLTTFICTPSAAQDTRSQIGTMEIDGAHAYVNDKQVSGNTIIYDGDTVATGEATSVRIKLTAKGYEGYIQLDENTDPNFILAATCMVVKVLKGQTFVAAKRICIDDPNLGGAINSKINLKTTAEESELTVISGSVSVERPSEVLVGKYQRYTATAAGLHTLQSLGQKEINDTTEWTRRYFKGKGPNIARGVGIVTFIGVILHVIKGGKHHDRPRTTTDSTPSRQSPVERPVETAPEPPPAGDDRSSIP